MPLISIVMPCFNAGKYLRTSVQSVIDQTLPDWELIIVNDGSTDDSEIIANEMAATEQRIRVVSQTNGGYVSARLKGYSLISETSRYVIFYDSDDRLDPSMLQLLSREMESNAYVGAVYCDHVIMDEKDTVSIHGFNMPRYIPTAFWIKELDNAQIDTPFISIFCWTKMMEPMTLIRRSAYEQTPGWDLDFGKGLGNIGEGVFLFSEIALQWKVHYINQPLYYYRRHSEQMSAIKTDQMEIQVNKVIDKWKQRINQDDKYSKKIGAAIIFLKYRLSAKKRLGSWKHLVRHQPIAALKSSFSLIADYIFSLPLVFTYRNIVD